jgi:uncharacterized protein (DUF1330 family)
MPVEPDLEQLQEMQELAGSPEDGPLVMLNLNKYKDRAAYLRYGEVAARVLERVGGKILWHAPVASLVIGEDGDAYDEVIAVWYPSAKAFVALATDPEIMVARVDRVDGLEKATLLRCESGAEPVLAAP